MRSRKRKEIDRACRDQERQREIRDVETAEKSLRREIEDYVGETETDRGR